jgi:Mn2+/Fe2+ NRAMP family transporter
MQLSGLRARVFVFLAVIGPGIITASVDNDAGGIYTYSVAGAQFGYSLLWTLIPITVALIVVQEMVARMGVVTGKGLADLIREEYGFRTTFILMVVLLVANFGNTVAEFAGLASGASVLHINRWVVVPLGALFVWVLVVRGTSRIVERVFLVASLLYMAYPLSGLMAHPDWTRAFFETVKPTTRISQGELYMIIGLVGTTIAPWMQFYLQSAVVEKNVPLEHYSYSKWDVIIGCVVTDLVAFFIIVACAATIFVSGHREISDAGDAAIALAPLAGPAASHLFAFGLVNASLFSACILPLATAYGVCEGLGLESGIDKSLREAPTFYILFTALILFGGLAVLLMRQSMQVPIILLSQVANGVILPFVLIFMLRLCNREDLMGPHRNTRALNIIAIATCTVMIVLTVLLVAFTVWPDLGGVESGAPARRVEPGQPAVSSGTQRAEPADIPAQPSPTGTGSVLCARPESGTICNYWESSRRALPRVQEQTEPVRLVFLSTRERSNASGAPLRLRFTYSHGLRSVVSRRMPEGARQRSELSWDESCSSGISRSRPVRPNCRNCSVGWGRSSLCA